MKTKINGARVLMPGGEIIQESLVLEDGKIVKFGSAEKAREWDAGGCLLLPGIVDMHGDAFEHLITPREGAAMNRRLAIWEAANQMLATGITTAYFSLTYTWEPGSRDREFYLAFDRALEAVKSHLSLDAKLHLRFEIYHLHGVGEVLAGIARNRIDILSFNDHISHYEEVASTPQGLAKLGSRFQVDPDEVVSLLNRHKVLKTQALQEVKRLAALCCDKGIIMASHDEEEKSVRQWYHDLGCSICEFPLYRDIARLARELGDDVVTGAPNVLKGGSLYGRLSSRDLIEEGLCNILASDYYYPALLQAAFMLHDLGIGELGAMWNLVSLNPAQALGLQDRGLIQEGMRADLIAVDDTLPGLPRVRACFVNGALCYQRN